MRGSFPGLMAVLGDAAIAELSKRIVSANNADVDVISGASESSAAFLAAIEGYVKMGIVTQGAKPEELTAKIGAPPGVHGGNRLGGNAVADIVAFGRIAGTKAAAFTLRK